MAQLVVLLRGINVGPHKRMKMAELRAVLQDGGYRDVRTHLQSGNVILRSGKAPATVERGISAEIARAFGFDVDVVIRTGEEVVRIVADDPLAGTATDGGRYVVAFLSAEADPAAAEALSARDFGPEELRVRGREIYAWCPEGLRDGPLSKALARQKLAPLATVRNWNTVTRLRDMVGDGG